MNEKGLVIEIMRSNADYPIKDHRPALNELQWIQYQLDNASSIEDVLNHDKLIRIHPVKEELHFLVCDQTGAKMALEFKDGKLVVFKGDDLPLPILANTNYNTDLQQYKLGKSSRFTTVVNHIKNYNNSLNDPIEYSFNILKNVALEGSWSIVYDLKNKNIYY